MCATWCSPCQAYMASSSSIVMRRPCSGWRSWRSPLGGAEPLEQRDPARVQRVQQPERDVDRQRPRVGQLGPPSLFGRLDRGRVLGERQADASVGVEVAVGDEVHHLPDGPPAGPVRRIELGVVETRHRGAEPPGRRRDAGDALGAPPAGHRAVIGEPADRIAEVGHGSLAGVVVRSRRRARRANPARAEPHPGTRSGLRRAIGRPAASRPSGGASRWRGPPPRSSPRAPSARGPAQGRDGRTRVEVGLRAWSKSSSGADGV